ncbi:hypothetical protein [Clostridium sp. Marseille-Q7071]
MSQVESAKTAAENAEFATEKSRKCNIYEAKNVIDIMREKNKRMYRSYKKCWQRKLN